MIITIAFTAVAVSLIQLVGEYLLTQQTRDDRRIADSLAGQAILPFEERDAGGLFALSESAAAENDGRILFLDPYGAVLVDSESALNGTLFRNEQAARVLRGADSDYGLYTGESGFNFIYAAEEAVGVSASAIRADGRLLGAVVYISYTQDIYGSLRDIQWKIIAWLLLVAVAAIILTTFTSRIFTVPMGELSEGISRMSKGDLSTRVKVRGRSEFAQLASAFNSMSERLERLDQSRSQFVSNASHELKTPLATMKILIESILYQGAYDQEMTVEFLSDVNKEIDRLNRIVSDLLTLVGMDSGGMALKVSDIRLRDVVTEQVKRLTPLARENGIDLDVTAREAIDTTGDAEKLTQVIYNVIDNAIKYTPRGGQVHVELNRAGKRAFIRVQDTGIGIPASDLPHIFDRFYRVDKARSRATGGTGLGLSIVKQILVMHGGDITAASRENEGSTFTIELPVNPQKKQEG